MQGGGRLLEPDGASGRQHNLSYEKSGITIVRRPCEDGDQWNRWWEVGMEPKITVRIEPRIQHNDARRRNITISRISWWASTEHTRNWNHNITTIRPPERTEADRIGGGRRGDTRGTNPKDTISPRLGRLNEASGIGGDTEGRHTPNTPEGTISPRFGSLNERRRAGAAVIDPK